MRALEEAEAAARGRAAAFRFRFKTGGAEETCGAGGRHTALHSDRGMDSDGPRTRAGDGAGRPSSRPAKLLPLRTSAAGPSLDTTQVAERSDSERTRAAGGGSTAAGPQAGQEQRPETPPAPSAGAGAALEEGRGAGAAEPAIRNVLSESRLAARPRATLPPARRAGVGGGQWPTMREWQVVTAARSLSVTVAKTVTLLALHGASKEQDLDRGSRLGFSVPT